MSMNSQFDVQIAYIQDIFRQASLDSQRLTGEVKLLREQLQQLQHHIESKTDNILREINPRIDQLEEKMELGWGSVQAMDRIAWEELNQEKEIFISCEKLVIEMQSSVEEVQRKV